MFLAEFLDALLAARSRIDENFRAPQQSGDDRDVHGRVVHHENARLGRGETRAVTDALALDALQRLCKVSDALPVRHLLHKREREGRTFSVNAPHLETAPHHLQKLLGNVEAQAGPLDLARLFRIQPVKGGKELLHILLFDAASGIGDGNVQRDLVLRFLVETDGERNRSLLRIFHCVCQYVRDDLLDTHLVADETVRRLGADPHVKCEAALLRPQAYKIHKVVHEGRQLIFHGKNVHLARLDLRKIEDVVDDGKQAHGSGARVLRISQHVLVPAFPQDHLVHADNGVDGRPNLMAHHGKERRLGLVRIFRRLQRVFQRLALLHGAAHFRIDVRESHTNGFDLRISSARLGIRARKAQPLVAVSFVVLRQEAISQDRGLGKTPANFRGLDQPQIFVPVFRLHETLGILPEFFEVREMRANLRRARQLPLAVANAFIGVEVDIIDAAVIGGEGIDHVFLLRLQLLLRQKLLLQRELLFQFLLLAPVLGLGNLFFQRGAGGSPRLHEQDGKQSNERSRRQRGLHEAPPGDPVGNRADLLIDHAFPHKISQHPVRALDRHIAKGLLYIVVSNRDYALLAFLEISRQRLERVSALKFGVSQRLQKIAFAGKAVKHHVGKRRAFAGVDVAECGIVVVRLQGKIPQHAVHVDFHEAGDQRFPFQRQAIHRHGDNRFFAAVRVFQRNLGARQIIVVEAVNVDVRPRTSRSVNQPVAVHERELFQPVKLLHARLV